jgi:predicted GNAT family N-acyltransferase
MNRLLEDETVPDPLVRPLQGEAEIAAAMEVRLAVFVQEQGFPSALEFDEHDAVATHIGLWTEDAVVGTARLFQLRPSVARLGRVAVQREFRGRGWGRLLVAGALREADRAGFREVEADAQVHLLPFYATFGFVPEGEPFEEFGIPHRSIRRQAPTLAASSEPVL